MFYFWIIFGLTVIFSPTAFALLQQDESFVAYSFFSFPVGMCLMALGLITNKQSGDSRTLGIKINPAVLVVLIFILVMGIGLINKFLL